MENTKQNLTSLPKESQQLALSESKESKNRLDEVIGVCLAMQKLYGRDVSNTESVINFFQSLLGKYPAKKVIRAFETWLERSQEFPTPADIIGLIKRNGRPPVKESDIIAIRKKEVCDWTRAEGELVEEWNRQQREAWADIVDEHKENDTMEENYRLRQQVRELKAECHRAWEKVREVEARNYEAPLSDKVANTVAHMRLTGAKPEDIAAFLEQAA